MSTAAAHQQRHRVFDAEAELAQQPVAPGIGPELVAVRHPVGLQAEHTGHRIGRLGPDLARDVGAVQRCERLPVAEHDVAELVREQQQPLAFGQVAGCLRHDEDAAEQHLGVERTGDDAQFDIRRRRGRCGQPLERGAYACGAPLSALAASNWCSRFWCERSSTARISSACAQAAQIHPRHRATRRIEPSPRY
ncbi:hypothetical protein [Azohydromonas sediminis]|uniref:hypothetical protein n=1 Tax=Azohydromonas sediminis TaxID=2259674 RepID=UPI000E64C68A|nr:hypothetical protein [Azohydromonas sediminis]